MEELDALEKAEQEGRQGRRETILKTLEIRKKLANEIEDDADIDDIDSIRPASPPPNNRLSPPSEFPNFAPSLAALPQVPTTTVVENWFRRMPESPTEHPYAVAHQMQDTYSGLDRFMAPQTVSTDLLKFSGAPEEWYTFYSDFVETTELCNLSHRENLIRLRKALKGKAREAVIAHMSVPTQRSTHHVKLANEVRKP